MNRSFQPVNKVLLIAVLMLIVTVSTFAQLKVSLSITSHPDPYLSNWPNIKNTVIVTATNSGTSTVDAKFDCKVSLDGALIANTKPESMRTLTLQPGVSQFYGEDLVPLEAMKIYGGAEKTAVKSGMLPAGFYEFCVALIHPQAGSELTPPVCKYFTITSYQIPILMQPGHEDVLSKSKRALFRWTAITPKYPSPVSYRVAVFEVLKGQIPVQAFRVNRPILDKTVAVTQMLWPEDIELPRQGMQYVWSVQTLDDKRNIIGEKEWAEPFTFTGCCTGDTSDLGSKVTGVDDPIADGAQETTEVSTQADKDSTKFAPKVQIVVSSGGSNNQRSVTLAPPTLNICCNSPATERTITWHTIMTPYWPASPTLMTSSGNYSWAITGLPGIPCSTLSGTYFCSPATWNSSPVDGSGNLLHPDHSATIPSSCICSIAPGVYTCTLTITRGNPIRVTQSTTFTVNVYPVVGAATIATCPICSGEDAFVSLAVNPNNAQVNWEFSDDGGAWQSWFSGNDINTNTITPAPCLSPPGSVTRTYRATVDPSQWGLPPSPPLACPNVAQVPCTVYCSTTATLGVASTSHTIEPGNRICSDNNNDGLSNYPVILNLTAGGNGTISSWTAGSTDATCIVPPIPGILPNQTYQIACAGTYTFTVIRQNGTCPSQTEQVTIIVADPPPIPIIEVIEIDGVPASGGCPFKVCPNDDAKLRVQNWTAMPPGTKFQWWYNPNEPPYDPSAPTPCPTFPGTWVAAGQGYEQNTNEIGPINTNWDNTWWMVTVQDANSICDPVPSLCCRIDVIKAPCVPVITITGPNPKCAGSSVILTATMPTGPNCGPVSSYQWYLNGMPIFEETNSTLSATAPGNYTVVAIGPCQSTKSKVVKIKDHVVTVVIEGNCCPKKGETVNLCATGSSTCTGAGTYVWSTGATTNCISVVATVTTTYTVTYTDTCGCKAQSSFTVTVCN